MGVWKAINIISWGIEKYENVKKFIIQKYKAYRTRKVRRLVDDGNVDDVADIVHNIKKRRQERHDST